MVNSKIKHTENFSTTNNETEKEGKLSELQFTR